MINNIAIKDIQSILKNYNEANYSSVIKDKQVGIFDNFFDNFLAYFNDELISMLSQYNGKAIEINVENISLSAVLSLKIDLIDICTKTILVKLFEDKQENLIEGKDSKERYEYFNLQLQAYENKQKLIERYPVLEKLILNRIKSKLTLIEECISRISRDIKRIQAELGIASNALDNMTFSSGDSHNEGRAVLILTFSTGESLIYKPHSLSPEKAFNKILDWVNESGNLKYHLKNTKSISCGLYGWQEYIRNLTCENEGELRRYFYRMGASICIFNLIRTQDIHYENVISCGEFPMFIDLETLFSNQYKSNSKKDLLHNFLRKISESVYGTLLIPQNLELAYMDVDISGINGGGGQRSEKHEGFRLVNLGTDEIKYEKDFIVSNEQKNRTSLNNKPIETSDYIMDLEAGFYDLYTLILQKKDEFIEFLSNEPALKCSYRQILRPTALYYKYIMAAQHPAYLSSFDERQRLFSILKGKNVSSYEEERRINLEIESLMKNDIPYFWTELETRDLFSVDGECISNYYKNTILDLIKEKIGNTSDLDLREQLYYIRSSISSTTDNKRQTGLLENGSIKDIIHLKQNPMNEKNEFLYAARQIGDYIASTAVWNEERDKCTWLALNQDKKGKSKFGILNYSLYEGMGVILFLASLAKETGEEKFTDIAKSAIAGMEELFKFNKLDNSIPFSVFHGIGSIAYIYYNLSVLWEDQKLYEKFLDNIKLLSQRDLEKETELDIISGAAGIVIFCINIYEKVKEPILLETAGKYGEFLYNAIESSSKSFLTGFSHGYAGFATALFMLHGYTGEEKYMQLAMKMVHEENKEFCPVDTNWKDLRSEDNKGGQVYWCHGAPGIALARTISLQYANPEDSSLFERDIELAINKLLEKGFNHSLSDCLCHGIIGNLDILLTVAAKKQDRCLLDKTYSLAEAVLKTIMKEGLRVSTLYSIETINFMLGLSGIGYGMLHLNNPKLPSILSLDVFEKEI